MTVTEGHGLPDHGPDGDAAEPRPVPRGWVVTRAGDNFLTRRRLEWSPEGLQTPVSPERVEKLTGFGLTIYEARVYLALLDFGTATASQIPAASRVPRTRIYATMQHLHAKGLVQILPEKPLRYRAVPFSTYLRRLADEHRERASQLSANAATVAREFTVSALRAPERRGRFEAIYGRRNVRQKLVEMYRAAESEIVAIGSLHSPARIVNGMGSELEERAAAGVAVKFAFFVEASNEARVKALRRYSSVRHIDFFTPVDRHSVDAREFLMSHPIPDDDSAYRGEDIAIWTDDPAIASAMAQMTERIWAMGKPVDFRARRGSADRRRGVTPTARS